MTIKRVWFDYGGLLAEPIPQTTRAHKLTKAYLGSRGIIVTAEKIADTWDTVINAYRKERRETHVETPIKILSGRFLSQIGIFDVSSLETLALFYTFHEHDFRFYEDVQPFFNKFNQNIQLGIVSDCPHNSLEYELNFVSLKERFNPIIVSCTVGYRKPHPEIYMAALRASGNKAYECLFVSHEEKDLTGAINVGMQALLINREKGETLFKIMDYLK